MSQTLAPSDMPAAPARPWLWLHTLCFEQRARQRSLRVLGLLTLVVILLALSFSAQGVIPAPDMALSEAIRGLDQPPIPLLAEAVSLPGYSPWNALLAAACCLLVAWWLHWKVGLYLALITALQGLTTLLLRFPIRVPRPMATDLRAPLDAIESSSFPSGHTTMYVVLLGFVLYLLWRHAAPARLRGGAFLVVALLIVLVGPARVQMGAHWIGDVVAAYLIGFFFLLFSIDVYEARLLPHLRATQATGIP